MIRIFAKHHNKIQLFGYEVANLVLILQQFYSSGGSIYGFNLETWAGLALLLGSALIWRFDPATRPHLLFYGGWSLTVGGGFLTAAGYVWTGTSVILASLETTRGGVRLLDAWVGARVAEEQAIVKSVLIHCKVAHASLNWYQSAVAVLVSCLPRLGYLINERPFVTGALIKAPLRLEFVGKKVIAGDWIGAAVGVSWLLLGDLALAFNDAKLQVYAIGGYRESHGKRGALRSMIPHGLHRADT